MSDSPKILRTSQIADALGVHANTIRIYEERGFLPEIPRGANGYREYTAFHLEQARLAHIATQWPYLVETKRLREAMVRSAASSDLDMAMELAYKHLARVRTERTNAEAAVAFLERWAAGYIKDTALHRMHISQAANHLNVTVDMLRNWERSGLITVPRDPDNGYRLYSTAELGRLRVIRVLVHSGYSLMAVLRMLRQFDSGETQNLRDALHLPQDESANEYIEVIADRWLSSLVNLEERAHAIIRQLEQMITMFHTT